MYQDNLTLSCNTSSAALDLSDFCAGGGNQDICLPSIPRPTARIVVGVWCTIHSIIGSFGNLLTLLAIPYAIAKKR